MRLLDLLRGEQPQLCAIAHPVTCHYVHTVERVGAIGEAITGLRDGDRIERRHQTIWHNQDFTHDDIEDQDVLRGLRRIEVAEQDRRYLPISAGKVWLVDGRMKVFQTDPCDVRILGFFAGLARSPMDAIRWAATGDMRHLISGVKL